MTSPHDLHAAVLARLQALAPAISVYDGDVPDDPPADGQGRVAPYVVLWPAPGYYPHAEADAVAPAPAGELAWETVVTVVAGTPAWWLDAVPQVRGALVGYQPAPHAGPLREEPGMQNAIKDTDTKPARWYSVLRLTLLTA